MFDYKTVAFWTMVIGGLGLFLYGISLVSKVIKKMAGKKLRLVIDKCTNNRFSGLLVGTGLTSVIQSSSGTSALTIGLVRAGVMSFVQSCAIIIGANIGTTITAFIISIPILEYMPIALFIGAFIVLLTTRRKWQNIGDLIFAFGAIFFGLWIMEMNLKSLADVQGFQDMFVFLNDYPWLGLLVGALATVCLQSSSAVIGVLQGIYAASLVSLSSSVTLFGILPILFGANIGTTITAVFACIGGSKESKRVALFHVLYNVCGALLFMGVLYIFQDWLKSSSTWYYLNSSSEVVWYVSPKLQLALCHLVFNVVTAAIFFPLITPLSKLISHIIKGDDPHRGQLTIKELDNKLLKSFPTEGIALAKQQVLQMFGFSQLMFETIGKYLDKPLLEDASFVHDIEANIDRIDRQLNEYLLSADKGDLSKSDLEEFSIVLKGCKDIERIGDYGENLISFFENADDRKEKYDSTFKSLLISTNQEAISFIQQTISCFDKEDKTVGLEIIQKRRDINNALDNSINQHFDLLTNRQEHEPTKYLDLVFVDILNCYQRVFSHCSNIAKLFGTDKVYLFTTDKEQENFAHLKDRY